MRTLPLTLLLPALLSLPFAALQSAEWEYLFKGASHGDFYFDFLEEAEAEDIFEITADGTLIIHGEDQPEAYLQTLDEFENYEIEFEWRWPDEPGNGGIQLHSTSDTAWSIWPESIEVQLQHENAGDFWLLNTELEVEEEEQMPKKASERNRRLRLKVEKPGDDDLEKKPGKWNKMRIVAEEDTLEVYLNDKLVNKGTDLSRQSGFITIQAEESNLELRNFRLRLLED